MIDILQSKTPRERRETRLKVTLEPPVNHLKPIRFVFHVQPPMNDRKAPLRRDL
jgi:hypothetical protein